MNLKEKFTWIYEHNYWKSKESVSGGGSELANTKELIKALPQIIEKYNINSMLDVPCGDFNLMRKVRFPLMFNYVGVDIVDDLIINNRKKYHSLTRQFIVRDATCDKLPMLQELIFSKDFFIHLSLDNIIKSILNFKDTGSVYLMTCSDPTATVNKDQDNGGAWRPLNLMLSPFNFPEPLEIVRTNTTIMGLWLLSSIKIE
jgi:hypothetical protein